MQLFGARHEESPEEFRRQTGAKRGGEIGFLTYAVLLGRSGGQPVSLGGLLYTVGDAVWFEDFERDNWFARIIGSRNRYEKTELTFQKQEVAFTRQVSRSAAQGCISGSRAPESLPGVPLLLRVFSQPVTQVHLRDGSSLFFEIMLPKEFSGLFANQPSPA